MATMPCDRHGAAVRGRLCTAYPALLQDGIRKTAKRRLCVDCMRAMLLDHTTDWVDQVLKAEMDEIASCTRCGVVAESNGSLSRFFCTAYLDGKTRRDYSAMYCPTCASATIEEFGLRAA